jgi:TPR repeat protein
MSSLRDIAAVMTLTGNSGVAVAESFGMSYGIDLWDDIGITEEWLRTMVESGVAQAQHALAICIGLGAIQPRHADEARDLASEAASQDFPPALLLSFGFAFDDLEHGLISVEQALEPLERAVALGYPKARYKLSFWLSHGDRFPRDLPRAAILLQAAADDGEPESMTRLGTALLDSQDLVQVHAGLKYLQSAAGQGWESALSKLADWYGHGCPGLDPNYALAREFDARLKLVTAPYRRLLDTDD